jgi:glycolate oxidase FAD binding subunit
MTEGPKTIDDVQHLVCTAPRWLPRGGGTKPALSTPPPGVASLNLSGLSKVKVYEPAEFTFTALAGTPLAEVTRMLAEHGQYLPFDPPFVERGATLGGTVASGLSGPGRYQYGGVRDFLLGARYVDSEGRLIYAGGQVVKNAAGFDLPKLMVSSLGRLGVLVELTFKVFPKPEATATLRLDASRLEDALEMLFRLSSSQFDLFALELVPTASGASLWLRLGGLRSAMPPRLEALRTFVGSGEAIQDASEGDFWHEMSEFTWVPQGWSLVKVPLTPRRILTLEASLKGQACLRRYSSGGQAAWVALPGAPQILDGLLMEQGLSGLVLFGQAQQPRLGVKNGEAFERKVKAALDPSSRFLE